MITVKKNAIKYRDSDGAMKDSGVLCQVRAIESGGDNPLQYITFANGAVFRGAVFPENYVLNVTITPDKSQGTNLSQKFMNTKNLDLLNILFKGENGTLQMGNFIYGSSVKKISMKGADIKPIIFGNAYSECRNLEIIDVMHDLSNSTNVGGAFTWNVALKEVRFVENTIKLSLQFAYSALLSDDSIQSIINGLATVETAQTLTFHADVKAKLTEEQIATITSKNWTLA